MLLDFWVIYPNYLVTCHKNNFTELSADSSNIPSNLLKAKNEELPDFKKMIQKSLCPVTTWPENMPGKYFNISAQKGLSETNYPTRNLD